MRCVRSICFTTSSRSPIRNFADPGEAGRHRLRINNMLDSAAGIIGNSQATLDDLDSYAQVGGRQAPAEPWRLGSAVRRRQSNWVRPPLDRPYFVILGTIEGRKNHILLLQTWRKLVAERGVDAPTLVVIGQRGWEARGGHRAARPACGLRRAITRDRPLQRPRTRRLAWRRARAPDALLRRRLRAVR